MISEHSLAHTVGTGVVFAVVVVTEFRSRVDNAAVHLRPLAVCTVVSASIIASNGVQVSANDRASVVNRAISARASYGIRVIVNDRAINTRAIPVTVALGRSILVPTTYLPFNRLYGARTAQMQG